MVSLKLFSTNNLMGFRLLVLIKETIDNINETIFIVNLKFSLWACILTLNFRQMKLSENY